MKRVIQFSRGYIPAVMFSLVLIIFGLVGFFTRGFNYGVEFQAGIKQGIQLAYPALEVRYAGKGDVKLTVSEDRLIVVFAGAEVQARTLEIGFKDHPTIESVASALAAEPQVSVSSRDTRTGLPSSLIVPTFQGETRLGQTALLLNRSPADEAEVYATINKVREAVSGIEGCAVQAVKPERLQRFTVRVQDDGKDPDFSKAASTRVKAALEKAFGADHVVIMSTDYVGAQYSEDLSRQSLWLFSLTVLVILAYATIRFGFQYGFGAVLATVHDAIIMVCFVVWTRMEFTVSTIAALLTILGYSINDTIVQFDRVREDRRLNPNDPFKDVLNRALTETLGRTIITTMTTMITVLAIYFFTSGSLKDFALALFVGMISGTYSTIFIASAFVLWWDRIKNKRKAAAALVGTTAKPRAVKEAKTPDKQ